MDKFKPVITYEKPMVLWDIPGQYEKVYSCPMCQQRLAFGQMTCRCGHPIVWEGVKEWDRRQAARKRGKR